MINVDKASYAMLGTVYDDQDDAFWESFGAINRKSWEAMRFSRGTTQVLKDAGVDLFGRLKATARFWFGAGGTARLAFIGLFVGALVGYIVGLVLTTATDPFLFDRLAWFAQPIGLVLGAAIGFDQADKRLAAEYFS